MSRLTPYGKQFIGNSLFGQSIDIPPFWYLALCSSAPTESATGDQLSEPEGISYQRAEYPNSPEYWIGSGYSVVANSNIILFPVATEDWGAYGFWALCRSPHSGLVVATGEFNLDQIVDAGDQAAVDPFGVAFAVYQVSVL